MKQNIGKEKKEYYEWDKAPYENMCGISELKSLLESEKEMVTVFRQPKAGELVTRNYTARSENSKKKRVEIDV